MIQESLIDDISDPDLPPVCGECGTTNDWDYVTCWLCGAENDNINEVGS